MMNRRLTHLFWQVLAGVCLCAGAAAQGTSGVNEWLARMHEAGRNRTYLGIYVVSNNVGMRTAKIWHVCDGTQQMERVESLTGTARSTIRRNDEVVTYLPESKTAIVEKRESLNLFPNLLQSAALPDHYDARLAQIDRVAGLQAQVLELVAKDGWRYGYRIWVEKETGLVIKMQTRDAQGLVLEEAAFSEIELNAPVKLDNLAKLMKANTDATRGVRVLKPEQTKTTALEMGWTLKSAVPGFKPMSCYKRAAQTPGGQASMQWIFSDGLATISIFAQPHERQAPGQDVSLRMGATHTLARRVDAYWLTLMGEVPPVTLKAMADGLERSK